MIASDKIAGMPLRFPSEVQALPDEQVVARVLSGEVELFEILMRRYNATTSGSTGWRAPSSLTTPRPRT
jgi:hypothetical protein